MNKEQMEAIWNGPLQSALKKARFKADERKMYEVTLKLVQKVPVRNYSQQGLYKNEREATNDLQSKLRTILYGDYDSLTGYEWSFTVPKEVK